MATQEGETVPQITIGNNETTLTQIVPDMPDTLEWWVAMTRGAESGVTKP